MAGSGTASLDFGAFPGATDATVAVTGQAGIVAGSLVGAWIRPAGSAVAYPDVILADSPVAYFRMGEGSGNLVDEVAGKPGFAVGSPTYGVAGALVGDADTAINFDASGDYFNVADHADFDLGDGPWSVEMWVKRTTLGGTFQTCLGKGTQFNVDFRVNNKFGFDADGANRCVTESGSTADTNWHHFVAMHNGSGSGNSKIYKDGADVTADVDTSIVFTSNAVDIWIAAYTTGTYPLLGMLDELAIYNAVLTPAQVLAHYNAGALAHSADEHRVEELLVVADTIVAGTGFTIFGRAGNNLLYGAWTCAWAWS